MTMQIESPRQVFELGWKSLAFNAQNSTDAAKTIKDFQSELTSLNVLGITASALGVIGSIADLIASSPEASARALRLGGGAKLGVDSFKAYDEFNNQGFISDATIADVFSDIAALGALSVGLAATSTLASAVAVGLGAVGLALSVYSLAEDPKNPGRLITDRIENLVQDILNSWGTLSSGFESFQRSWQVMTDLSYSKIMSPQCNSTYLSCRTFVQRVDPLTLDLNGDGLNTTGIDPNHPILFDHDGDGIKTATGWVKPDDGFLVLDRNGNGVIDSGRELFGDSTALYTGGTAADGFAALAQEDTNHDGLINASDAHWNDLRIWRDLNQDGISQSNELLTLASQNIAALKVGKSANNQTLANGNQIADLGGYIKTDGSEGALGEVVGMGDINLASNPFYSQFPDTLPLTQAAQGITDMHGAGMVRSLREAASLDGNLATQVAALSAPMTRAQMMAQVDSIIGGWAATSGMQTSVQQAAAKGYTLKYIPPGATATDILAIFGMDGGGTGSELTDAERQRRANLKAQTEHINQLVATLERFNGMSFVTVGDNSITTGAGRTINESTTGANPQTGDVSHYVFMGFSAGQLALLEQSYTQLKQSVYDGLVLEGRLKHYLDGIQLSITGQGVRMGFEGMEAVNDFEWRIAA